MNKFALAVAIFISQTPAFAQQVVQTTDGIFVCRGNHPRCSVADQSTYPYYQFSGQHVGQMSGVSDQLENGPPENTGNKRGHGSAGSTGLKMGQSC